MTTPWWQFWNPQSGILGGLIFGVILGLIAASPLIILTALTIL